ncbi:VOC family protein [Kibdelosporangium phytohabitans]|uniref:Glyoxalase n=1 Tax=Kibdelosporangium phytohabitans TaxID=860235 RepID=A0A0N9I1F3_9PSEU|nr:VOC family protein [Kibdelosporangium phytohabitans]ALG12286.1 glyoxalase [Kibdelosporangium phytohabitans]MBE1463841.1 putative enzyme related to lactoylglutathione lyase [Kibdelosporangium phytohabitans]
MVSSIHNVSVDALDAYGLAEFWSKVYGKPVDDADKPGDPEVAISLGGGVNMFFQQVPESKSIKNRMHICLRPDGSTRDEEVDRLLELGATIFEDHRNPDGTGWAVLHDPEGNEFCVERSAAERGEV